MPTAYSPFGMTGMPGSNTGGTNLAVPTPASNATPAIGGSSNPFLPVAPTGSATAPITSSINQAPSSNVANTNVFALMNPGPGNQVGSWVPNQDDFIKAMKKSGYSAGDAALLYNFISNGAGYNPEVAKAMIAAQQPGIVAGRNDILEQFSARGLRNGSPAALGLADYMYGVQLNQGKIFADLYQQSVQNYLMVLMSGQNGQKSNSNPGFLQNLLTYSQAMSNLAPKPSGGSGGG